MSSKEDRRAVQAVREQFENTIIDIERMRDSFLGMAIDRGITHEVIQEQMLRMVRDFGESMTRHRVDPLVSHATVCSLVIATLQKWMPPADGHDA